MHSIACKRMFLLSTCTSLAIELEQVRDEGRLFAKHKNTRRRARTHSDLIFSFSLMIAQISRRGERAAPLQAATVTRHNELCALASPACLRDVRSTCSTASTIQCRSLGPVTWQRDHAGNA